jgi:hypothetical protein
MAYKVEVIRNIYYYRHVVISIFLEVTLIDAFHSSNIGELLNASLTGTALPFSLPYIQRLLLGHRTRDFAGVQKEISGLKSAFIEKV